MIRVPVGNFTVESCTGYDVPGRLCSSALWSRNKRSKLDALGSGEGWDFTEGECLIVSS